MPSALAPDTQLVEVPPIPQDAQMQQPDQFGAAAPFQANQGPETIALAEDKVGTQGNWMKKKEWLVKSNEAFDEIQNIVLEIQGQRKLFNEKYHAIDEEFDNFNKDLNLDQGKVEEAFESLYRYLEKKKKKELEALSSASNKENVEESIAERNYLQKVEALETKIKHHKEDLEQLKLDLKSIDDLDKSTVERIKRVDEQIAQAKDLFDKAKVSLDELWNIIDDKKARAIYYDLKNGTTENVKSILAYLKEDLMRDFDSVIETSHAQMAKAQEAIKKMEGEGLIIKNRSQRIEKLKLQDLQEREQAQKEAGKIPTKDEFIDLKKIKRQPIYWYEKIYDYVVTAASKIYRTIASLFGFESEAPAKKIHSRPVSSQPAKQEPSAVQPTAAPAPQREAIAQQAPLPLTLTPPPPLTVPTISTTPPALAPLPPTLASAPIPAAPTIQQPLAIPLPLDASGGMPFN